MKKLLALVLSVIMLLTMFSGTLGVFAADETTALTPLGYSGTMPQSSAAAWGFEDASLLTPVAEQNNLYMIAGNYGKTPRTEKAGITTEEFFAGNSSIYATFDGAGYAHFDVAVENPADLAAWITSAAYYIKADIKTTADFNGGVYFLLMKDGKSVGVHDYYGEYIFYQSATDGHYTSWGSRTSYNPARSAIQNKRVADWITGESVKVRVMMTGDKGTVWIDNFELEAATHAKSGVSGDTGYTGMFTSANCNLTGNNSAVGSSNNGGFEKSAGYWSATRFTDRNSSDSMGFLASYGQTGSFKVPVLDEAGNKTYDEAGNVIVENKSGEWGENTDIRLNAIAGKNATGQVCWDYAHTGFYSMKVYKSAAAVGGFAFYLPTELINAEKDYYMSAWVKLDDFEGAIEANVSNPPWGSINATYEWYGSSYMLGDANFNVSKEDVGDGWIHITSQVMDGAKIVENATGAVLNYYLKFSGLGLLYVDDVDLVEVTDYTPVISQKDFHINTTFNKATLTTASDADIWFTTDGTNPLYSSSAKLYDAANPIRIYDNLNLQYVGVDKATGEVSKVISQWFTAPDNVYMMRTAPVDDKKPIYYDDLVLPADAAAGDFVRLTYNTTETQTSTDENGEEVSTTIEVTKDAVMQFRGYGMNNSFTLTFDVTAAEDFTGETVVKFFLNGEGDDEAVFDGEAVTGTFIDVATVTEPGTKTVTIELSDLAAYDAIAPYIERVEGSGEVKVDNYKFVIDQVGLPILDVMEEDAPEDNAYFKDDYLVDVFPTFNNNTAYLLNGTMNIIYTSENGNNVYSTSFDVSLASGGSFSDWFDISEVIKKDGTYNLQYVFTDSRNFDYVCLEKTITYDAGAVVGDANGDGETDIVDLVRLQNYMLGNTDEIEFDNVWFDQEDEELGATDLAALRKMIWALF